MSGRRGLRRRLLVNSCELFILPNVVLILTRQKQRRTVYFDWSISRRHIATLHPGLGSKREHIYVSCRAYLQLCPRPSGCIRAEEKTSPLVAQSNPAFSQGIALPIIIECLFWTLRRVGVPSYRFFPYICARSAGPCTGCTCLAGYVTGVHPQWKAAACRNHSGDDVLPLQRTLLRNYLLSQQKGLRQPYHPLPYRRPAGACPHAPDE